MLKHRAKIESVSSLTQHAVLIDLFAKVLADNLNALICMGASDDADLAPNMRCIRQQRSSIRHVGQAPRATGSLWGQSLSTPNATPSSRSTLRKSLFSRWLRKSGDNYLDARRVSQMSGVTPTTRSRMSSAKKSRNSSSECDSRQLLLTTISLLTISRTMGSIKGSCLKAAS